MEIIICIELSNKIFSTVLTYNLLKILMFPPRGTPHKWMIIFKPYHPQYQTCMQLKLYLQNLTALNVMVSVMLSFLT